MSQLFATIMILWTIVETVDLGDIKMFDSEVLNVLRNLDPNKAVGQITFPHSFYEIAAMNYTATVFTV